jgi:hypothetical protein
MKSKLMNKMKRRRPVKLIENRNETPQRSAGAGALRGNHVFVDVWRQ